MSVTLVDSNIFMDLFTKDKHWYSWSFAAIERCAQEGALAINPIIYAEISTRFESIEALEETVFPGAFQRLPLPWNAGFLAGKAYLKYKRSGGSRTSPLPDFYIGAHAAVSGLRLLTRDAQRYKSYFPRLELISPNK